MKSVKKEHTDEYKTARCSIQKIMADHDEKYCHKLTVKLKARVTEQYLDYIDQLWVSIIDYTYIPVLTVLLKSICNGCIEVTWLIPARLSREIERNCLLRLHSNWTLP